MPDDGCDVSLPTTGSVIRGLGELTDVGRDPVQLLERRTRAPSAGTPSCDQEAVYVEEDRLRPFHRSSEEVTSGA